MPLSACAHEQTAAAAMLLAVPMLQAVGGVVLRRLAFQLLADKAGEEQDGVVDGFWPALTLGGTTHSAA